MLPDRVSNPGPLTYESGALPIALRGPAQSYLMGLGLHIVFTLFTKADNSCDILFAFPDKELVLKRDLLVKWRSFL